MNNNKKNNFDSEQISVKEALSVFLIGFLFFGSIISAAPSSNPPSGNPSIPINTLANPQYKLGSAISNSVNQALGIGYPSVISIPNGVTLGVIGMTLIGSLGSTNDGMQVLGDMTDMSMTVVCQTSHDNSVNHTSHCGSAVVNATDDGKVTVKGLAGSGSSTAVCVQLINGQKKLVRCP